MLINMPTLIIYIVPQLSLDKEPGYEGKQNVAYIIWQVGFKVEWRKGSPKPLSQRGERQAQVKACTEGILERQGYFQQTEKRLLRETLRHHSVLSSTSLSINWGDGLPWPVRTEQFLNGKDSCLLLISILHPFYKYMWLTFKLNVDYSKSALHTAPAVS